MISVRFLLVCEGPSDRNLVRHLERCCIFAGADEASGVAPDLRRLQEPIGNRVSEKLKVALQLEPTVDFAFLHRDADSQNAQPRHDEIREAVQKVAAELQYVAVVPVQETEAWLLLDESKIRRVAENPNGRSSLKIPRPSAIESIASPKEHLEQIILEASERSGRRREKIRNSLPQKKQQLIEGLDP